MAGSPPPALQATSPFQVEGSGDASFPSLSGEGAEQSEEGGVATPVPFATALLLRGGFQAEQGGYGGEAQVLRRETGASGQK